MSEASEGLFAMTPVSICAGDRVSVWTIFGITAGVVTATGDYDDLGMPLVQVDLDNGDRISIGIGRVHPNAR